MVRTILNETHLHDALGDLLARCRHRLFISTADVKDLHVPAGVFQVGRRTRASSIFDVFGELSDRDVQISLLHAGVPSGPAIERLKARRPENLTMRRCPRVHAKALIADGRWMVLGSANLTGAGVGAKGPLRRNFEASIWTDELDLIDPVIEMLEAVFEGQSCDDCGRRELCPVPLEEPDFRPTKN